MGQRLPRPFANSGAIAEPHASTCQGLIVNDDPQQALASARWDNLLDAVPGAGTAFISAAAIALALMDWQLHLAPSPSRRELLLLKACEKFWRWTALPLQRGAGACCIEPLPQDRRFTEPAWQRRPFNLIYQVFLLQQQWWHVAVTRHIARHVVLAGSQQLSSPEIAEMTPTALKERGGETTLFVKMTSQQKLDVVQARQNPGPVVGYLGDGISDAGALKAVDVGVSMDTAAAIARESPDIVFDYVTFAFLWYGLHTAQTEFQTGWFLESLLSHTLAFHIIRTGKLPFVQSTPRPALMATTVLVCVFGLWLPVSPFTSVLGFVAMPPAYWLGLAAILTSYLACVQLAKRYL